MELQTIRYAEMISAVTLDKLIATYERYLHTDNAERDATEILQESLSWDELNEERFAQDVKFVLASAEFSKELTNRSCGSINLNWIYVVRMQP